MYDNVLGNVIQGGVAAAGFGGAQVFPSALPFTGFAEFAFYIVAVCTLIAAGAALLRLIPKREH